MYIKAPGSFTLHYGIDPDQKIYELFPCLKDKKIKGRILIELANKNLLKSFNERLKAQGAASKVPLEVGDLVLLRVPHLSDKSQKVIYKFFHF